jgi:IS30 family transposase
MRRKRRRLSAQDRKELWARWRQGQSATEIGVALERRQSTVFNVLNASGGVALRPRQRAASQLSAVEREEISRGLGAGCSVRSIARQLGRCASTISREIARNGGRHAYRGAAAEKRAWDQGRRPKRCLLSTNAPLRQVVAQKLHLDWSPQQVAGWLKREYHDDPLMQISHETIYRSLFIQARGALKKELVAHLRSGRAIRRGKHASIRGHGHGQIPEAVSISERPAEAEDRAVPGHWEGDLIAGSNNSYIATLVERRSRFVMLVRVAGKDTESVVSALTKHVLKLPEGIMQTLTWDRGLELARHKRFTIATDVQVYFCDPRSPWQRGSNENTNGLLRQYFPKGKDLSVYTQRQLDEVANKLNTRPRLTLGFATPTDTLAEGMLL